jgi:hypothetical protein
MRKVRLSLDELVVDSFRTLESDETQSGTVRGHDFTQVPICTSGDSQCATCQAGGCPGNTLTCFVSCGRTNGGSVCIGPNC